MKSISLILLVATLILSCQWDKKDARDNDVKTDTRNVVDKSISGESISLQGKPDILHYLMTVPRAEVNFHFNTIADDFDTTQLMFLPDRLIDNMDSASVYSFEFGHPQEMKSIRQFRDATHDLVKVGFYKRLPFTMNTYDILVAFVLDSKDGHGYQRIEWQVLTFNKAGQQISAIDRLHELYTCKDTLTGLWWYASNEDPHYETWLKNKAGKFEMILQSEAIPGRLKGWSNE
jgi:hypothetical protein